MNAIQTIDNSYKNIMNKDAEGICSNYVDSDALYVILEGPRLSNRGAKNIFKGWADFCNSGLTLESIDWIEGPYSEEEKDMAWVGGIINLSVAVQGKTFTKTFRATFVLTKPNGKDWKIKHEHVSGAQEDPYGIGDWLKK